MRGLSYVGAETLSDEEAERMWLHLKEAFGQIFNHNAASLSFEELYRYAYSLVLHKRGQKLYEETYCCVRDELQSVAAAVREERAPLIFLEKLVKSFNDHAVNMRLTSDVLMYLDKNFVPSQDLSPVYPMGLKLFCEVVLRDPVIGQRCRSLLLSLISAERSGETVDLQPVRLAVGMFTSLSSFLEEAIYQEEFEKPFLQDTKEYYTREAEELARNSSVTEFLKKAQARMTQESFLVASHLSEETAIPLSQLLFSVWIAAHYKALANDPHTGAPFLMRNNKLEELHRMYCLFARVPGALEELKDTMKKTLEEYGYAILRDPEKAKEAVSFVSSFLSLKHKFSKLVREAFCDNQEMHAAMKTSFEGFLGSDTRYASFLAAYLDEFFRKGARTANEAETEEILESLLSLFRYLKDKDIFEAYYKQLLSRRLLQHRSASIEAEKLFVAKLRAECGQQYTAKLESMFRDLLAAGKLMEDFSRFRLQLSEGSAKSERCLGVQHGMQAELARQLQQNTEADTSVHEQELPPSGSCGSTAGLPCAATASSGMWGEREEGHAGGSPSSGDAPWSRDCSECAGRNATSAAEEQTGGGRGGESTLRAASHGLRVGTAASATPEFECTVLTHATWLGGGECLADLSLLPPSLRWSVDAFTTFYLSKHSGRVLKFALEEGRALVRGTFVTSRHDLDCSTLQMCILCLFNESTSLSVGLLISRLREKAGSHVAEAELRRQLTSLCTPKCRLLRKRTPEGTSTSRELHDGDILEVNAEFSMRLFRIKVPLVTLASMGASEPLLEPQAGADVPASIEQDRNHLVEAAIVRVMKSRQQIRHNDLLEEVTQLLSPRFIPSASLIKQRIEVLIEREYIQRGPEDMRKYSYVA
ncbi:cullin-3A [Cyclospora cayetanensis]|uniref:Cullin-3A n=1 Tax=Cyclospora cayetanensis TaxID=88456 RepID=A0A6P6RRB6_9EIME|nr:cullin-3A [Cyclospora cayetanensis]